MVQLRDLITNTPDEGRGATSRSSAGSGGGRTWPYCGVSVISTVFPPRLIPGMSTLDSAPTWPLYP
jgi:hypothetical protein